MRAMVLVLVGVLLAVGLCLLAAVGYLRATGLSARGAAGPMEARAARVVRRFALPPSARVAQNPIPSSAAAAADGMVHFADHCALCHGNDGAGGTQMGRGFYPPAPDMRLARTQGLSDGELFYIIENGIRFTGMPAFGTGTAAGAESTWRLVHFVRHLPGLTAEEIHAMEAMNPRAPEEIRQEIEEQQFLQGGGDSSPTPSPRQQERGHR
ncbi:MAG: c-type cytochrome [Acidobacteriota bacterium]